MNQEEFFCIGIDLGNDGAVMAYVGKNGAPQTILNSESETLTPSVVFWEQNEYEEINATVGDDAVPYSIIHPNEVVKFVRRDLGTDEIIEIYGNEMTPEKISSLILGKLKLDAEQHFNRVVTHAIITVPNYFGQKEKQATKSAAMLAGWDEENVEIINEPTAAVYTFFNDRVSSGGKIKLGEKILIFQLDADDFDCSLVEYKSDETQHHSLEVIKSGGTSLVGGDVFAEEVFLWIADEYLNKEGIDIRLDINATNLVMKVIKKAIYSLSKRNKRKIIVDLKPPVLTELSREKFNELCADLYKHIEDTIDNILETPHQNSLYAINPSLIDAVIMVGGPSRIKGIREVVEKKFPHAEIFQNHEEIAIAHGAALYGYYYFSQTDANE